MVRKPAVAGQFYPASSKELSYMIDKFLQEAPSFEIKGDLKGLILPHAGYIYSGIVAASGYKLLKKLDQNKKWEIFLLGPAHIVPLEGASLSLAPEWETPLGKVKVALKKELLSDLIKDIPEAHFQEHCLEVQLPFLQKVLKNFEIIPLVLGEVDYTKLASKIMPYIKENTIIIVSSDLSHYYPYEEAKALDAVANEAIPQKEIQTVIEAVEACGKSAILTLLEIAQRLNWSGQIIDYRNSGDTAGDKSSVVGYGAYVFYEPKV